MSNEMQTIPARHGVATFVPRGRTIKIINTYGKQVVSTWAFSLAAPPEEGDDGDIGEKEAEDMEKKTEELKKEVSKGKGAEEAKNEQKGSKAKKGAEASKEKEKKAQEKPDPKDDAEEHEDPPEQAPDTPENEKTTETTDDKSKDKKKQSEKRTWSSYLPSIPYRSKGAAKTDNNTQSESKSDPEAEKAQNEATSKKWSAYMPTGKSFSSYVPNMQIPDSKEVMSAFKSSHYRDPNKSYAEQLYDFSKTPVGAGTIAVASGSGTASSLYAAYNAYTQLNPFKSDQPPMEYLSLPHTRAATHHLVPQVDDTLLTNLRAPIMTLIEDTSPGAHDTLTAACDASQYAALGVDKPAEHGSCAENLVLALKQLNENAGLKGTKAVGADITVNIAPTPLHLFMNAPIEIKSDGEDGSGANGAKLKVEEPKGKKRSYVRFRAERDIVVVMSACPMDVGKQNGGKIMAANYMVEDANEDKGEAASKTSKTNEKSSVEKGKEPPKKNEASGKEEKPVQPKAMPKPRGGPAKIQAVKKSAEDARKSSTAEEPEQEPEPEPEPEPSKAEDKPKPKPMPRPRGGPAKIQAVKKSAQDARKNSAAEKPEPEPEPSKEEEKTESQPTDSKSEQPKSEDPPKEKKKPKKLARRTGTSTPAKGEES